MKNGFVVSIQSILSFKIRFDPLARRISFLVFASPWANRSCAAQANANVCSESFTDCRTRCPAPRSNPSRPAFSLEQFRPLFSIFFIRKQARAGVAGRSLEFYQTVDVSQGLWDAVTATESQLAETKRTASAMTSLSSSPVSLRKRTNPLVPLANFKARPIRTHRAEFLF